jgi:major vault protein
MLALQTDEVQKQLLLNVAKVDSENEIGQKKLIAKLAEQESLDKINEAELAREKAAHEVQLALEQEQLTQQLERLRAEVEAVVNKAGAVSPQMVSALQAFSDKALAEKMAESMAPLAILGGKSVADVFAQLLRGTTLEEVLTRRLVENEK